MFTNPQPAQYAKIPDLNTACAAANSGISSNSTQRDTVLGALNIELDLMHESLCHLDNRMSDLRARAFGSVPSMDKETGPKPVLSGGIAVAGEKINTLKKVIQSMCGYMNELDKLA